MVLDPTTPVFFYTHAAGRTWRIRMQKNPATENWTATCPSLPRLAGIKGADTVALNERMKTEIVAHLRARTA